MTLSTDMICPSCKIKYEVLFEEGGFRMLIPKDEVEAGEDLLGCEDCNAAGEGVKLVIDPYAQDVDNEENETALCRPCYLRRMQEM